MNEFEQNNFVNGEQISSGGQQPATTYAVPTGNNPSWMPAVEDKVEKKKGGKLKNLLVLLVLAVVIMAVSSILKNYKEKKDAPYEKLNIIISENNIVAVEEMLNSKKMNLNINDSSDIPPLYVATRIGNKEIIDVLIEHGADINLEDDIISVASPLDYAILLNKTDIAKYLISKGADVNKRAINGYTPLATACESSDLEFVKELINAGADIYTETESKMTVLHNAALGGKEDVYNYMLEQGIDEKKRDSLGRNTAQFALLAGNIKLVEEIQKRGVPVSEPMKEGYKIIHLASTPQAIDYVVKNYDYDINAKDQYGQTTLILNITSDIDTIKKYVELGVDVNAQDASGNTALIMACANFYSSDDSAEVIHFLIDSGADVKKKNDDGNTAKDYAEQYGLPKSIIDKL